MARKTTNTSDALTAYADDHAAHDKLATAIAAAPAPGSHAIQGEHGDAIRREWREGVGRCPVCGVEPDELLTIGGADRCAIETTERPDSPALRPGLEQGWACAACDSRWRIHHEPTELLLDRVRSQSRGVEPEDFALEPIPAELKATLRDALRLRSLESCILGGKGDLSAHQAWRDEAAAIEDRIRALLGVASEGGAA